MQVAVTPRRALTLNRLPTPVWFSHENVKVTHPLRSSMSLVVLSRITCAELDQGAICWERNSIPEVTEIWSAVLNVYTLSSGPKLWAFSQFSVDLATASRMAGA